MANNYLPYDVDQRLLLPPDMRAWLPEEHLALFVLDVVSELDLSAITRVYDAKDTRGRAGYHPVMMVGLLVYAYCVGKPSSRRIERATYEEVAFRVGQGLGPRATDSGMGTRTGWGSGSLSFCPTHT